MKYLFSKKSSKIKEDVHGYVSLDCSGCCISGCANTCLHSCTNFCSKYVVI
ncbi:AC3_0185 family rSAM-modified Cys-rich RiPP [Clostridium akagii]|uniref:AC3_0185 family rSAM-modified Cys-rich RiPP n=1 Tax=Clostridium akagii TaxID=91623 RepID=UPI0009FBEBC3